MVLGEPCERVVPPYKGVSTLLEALKKKRGGVEGKRREGVSRREPSQTDKFRCGTRKSQETNIGENIAWKMWKEKGPGDSSESWQGSAPWPASHMFILSHILSGHRRLQMDALVMVCLKVYELESWLSDLMLRDGRIFQEVKSNRRCQGHCGCHS